MRSYLYTGFLLLSLQTVQSINAQTGEQTKNISVKISTNYNTGLNYYGRTDSLKSSGFFPMAELWFNEKFYINAAPVFINNTVATFQYAGTITAAGYQFNADNKWFGNIYLVKPFYKENSKLAQSVLTAQTGATLTWLNSIVNLTVGADLKFSDKTDYGFTTGLDHIFKYTTGEKSMIVIDPSVFLNAGTQQFSNTAIKNSNGFLFIPGSSQSETLTTKKLALLSYEISAPVIFASGKFQFLFTPAYVIPQNVVNVDERPDLSETGQEMFYATAGIKISF